MESNFIWNDNSILGRGDIWARPYRAKRTLHFQRGECIQERECNIQSYDPEHKQKQKVCWLLADCKRYPNPWRYGLRLSLSGKEEISDLSEWE